MLIVASEQRKKWTEVMWLPFRGGDKYAFRSNKLEDGRYPWHLHLPTPRLLKPSYLGGHFEARVRENCTWERGRWLR